MRRIPAGLLVIAICFSLIAPALPQDSASALPACCRPGGRHHCAMTGMAGHAGASGAAMHSSRERCPYSPFLASSVPNTFFWFAAVALSVIPPQPTHRALHFADGIQRRIPDERTNQGRSPPSPLA